MIRTDRHRGSHVRSSGLSTGRRAGAALAVAGLVATGCNAASTTAHSTKQSTKAEVRSPDLTLSPLTGLDVEFTLGPALHAAVASKALTVVGMAPASTSNSASAEVVSLPVTGGSVTYDRTDGHLSALATTGGGLRFTAGGKPLALSSLTVNVNTRTLTGSVGGTQMTFPLTGTPHTSLAGNEVTVTGLTVVLGPATASALRATFGSAAVSGLPLGSLTLTLK